MRILDSSLGGLLRVAFSRDSRFLTAIGAGHEVTRWDWLEGKLLHQLPRVTNAEQIALSPDGLTLAHISGGLSLLRYDGKPQVEPEEKRGAPYAGGLAFSPDGRFLVASRYGSHEFDPNDPGSLLRWNTRTWEREPGFDHWWPFYKLAFGYHGEYLAGINPIRFELRFAVSGGLNGWARPGASHRGTHAHLSFSPMGRQVAFGWNEELHIMDAFSGKVVKTLYDPDFPFRDAAFTADGRRLGTVSDDGTIKFWDARTWTLAERYDWESGPLRCLAFAPDGACGVCGTADGKFVFFDVEG